MSLECRDSLTVNGVFDCHVSDEFKDRPRSNGKWVSLTCISGYNV